MPSYWEPCKELLLIQKFKTLRKFNNLKTYHRRKNCTTYTELQQEAYWINTAVIYFSIYVLIIYTSSVQSSWRYVSHFNHG
jgi:hypothetical protein